MRSLLVFSRDPGPTNQLVAVVERLSAPAVRGEPAGIGALRAAASATGAVKIAARGPGASIWREAGQEIIPWQGTDDQAAEALIAECDAGLLLTGASDIDEPGDRVLWRAARARRISSHVVLDHPANLGRRFRDDAGDVILPDWVYAPDAVFAERLVAAGVPRERIRLTGDLHHARLRDLAARVEKGEIERLRRSWGGDPSKTIILFASECGREMTKAGRSYPYDEVAVLGDLVKTLGTGKLPDNRNSDPRSLLLVVRPHPRDAAGKYDEWAAPRAEGLKTVISAEGSSHVALMAADLVVGMNSSLLYVAIELGRPFRSLTVHDLSAGKSRVG
jgi:hypothetical protein